MATLTFTLLSASVLFSSTNYNFVSVDFWKPVYGIAENTAQLPKTPNKVQKTPIHVKRNQLTYICLIKIFSIHSPTFTMYTCMLYFYVQ